MNDAPTQPDQKAPPPVPPPHTPTKWQRRTPNLLTFARLILAAMFFALLSTFDIQRSDSGVLLVATGIFLIAAITDALDGYFARKWNAITPFGRIMDPFADKVLVLGAFVMLLNPSLSFPSHHLTGFTAWMVVLIIARELLVTSIRGVYESRGIDFSASLSGKLKMIAQSIAVPLVLLTIYYSPYSDRGIDQAAINQVIAWVVTVVTVWSAVPYVSRAIKMRDALSD